MPAGCTILYEMILYGMGIGRSSIAWKFKLLFVSLWSFITYGLALFLKKPHRNGKVRESLVLQIVAMGLYYLVLLGVMILMQKIMGT